MGHGVYRDPFAGPDSGAQRYRVGAGEHLSLTFVVLPGESRDLRIDVDLTGEGASADLKGLYLCDGDEQVSFTVRLHHRSGGCTSRQKFVGLAGGNARVRFDGTIFVAPDAQKTEAYQENHNILLSDTAEVQTHPQLEIYADDVQCSHGATTGRLDEGERFYMQSRGIPESEARVLQMISFLSPVTEALSPEERERVEEAVRRLK